MKQETKDLIVRKIEEIAQDLGWSVSHHANGGEEEVCFEFAKQTPCGMDFNFSIIMEGYDVDNFYDNFFEYVDTFDEDYEACQWIGPDGHGKNGAPYHIKDIVLEFQKAWQMADKLLDEYWEFDCETMLSFSEKEVDITFTEEDKKYLLSIGHLEEDIPQIEAAIRWTQFTKILPYSNKEIEIDAEEVIEILGREEFLLGMSRSAFHWSARRKKNGIEVSFNSKAYFMLA